MHINKYFDQQKAKFCRLNQDKFQNVAFAHHNRFYYVILMNCYDWTIQKGPLWQGHMIRKHVDPWRDWGSIKDMERPFCDINHPLMTIDFLIHAISFQDIYLSMSHGHCTRHSRNQESITISNSLTNCVDLFKVSPISIPLVITGNSFLRVIIMRNAVLAN